MKTMLVNIPTSNVQYKPRVSDRDKLKQHCLQYSLFLLLLAKMYKVNICQGTLVFQKYPKIIQIRSSNSNGAYITHTNSSFWTYHTAYSFKRNLFSKEKYRSVSNNTTSTWLGVRRIWNIVTFLLYSNTLDSDSYYFAICNCSIRDGARMLIILHTVSLWLVL